MNPYQYLSIDDSKWRQPTLTLSTFRIPWFVAAAIVGVVTGFGHPMAMLSDARSDATGCSLFFGSWIVIAVFFSLIRFPKRRRRCIAGLDRIARTTGGLVFGFAAVWLHKNGPFAYSPNEWRFAAELSLAVVVSAIVEELLTLFSRSNEQSSALPIVRVDEPADARESPS